MARVRSPDERSRVSRDVAARWWSGSRNVSVKAQLVTGVILFALSAWLTVTSVSYVGSRQMLDDSARQIADLEQAHADLLAESQLATASFTEQLDALKATEQRQRAAIDELGTIQETLNRQLESRERQLAGATEQRDHARALVGDLQRSVAEAEGLVQAALGEKATLGEQLVSTEQNLSEVSRQRDAGRRVEAGLRWQVARLEDEVKQLRTRREMAQVWLKDWVLGSTEALEQLFVETGVDVEQLLQRIATPEAGLGGPLQVAEAAPTGDRPVQALLGDPMRTDIQRLAALQRLVRVLPLASPLDHFSITSGFGKRSDPFTKGWAFHPGLDLGAAPGSEALATAPGEVIQAGPAGPYGNMVEIDHGMGVVTRYAHLKKVAVAVGDHVQFRQAVGVIGSTGRSTALHLHYEVRIDGDAYDPARFLDAGRLLVGIFASPTDTGEELGQGGG